MLWSVRTSFYNNTFIKLPFKKLLKIMHKQDKSYRSVTLMLKKIFGRHLDFFTIFADKADSFITIFSLH